MAETHGPHLPDDIRGRFVELVDAGVAPELAQRERGIHTIYSHGEEVSRRIGLGASSVRFFRYHTSRPAGILSIAHLGFLPSHGVEITVRQNYGTAATGYFGLNGESNTIARTLHEPDWLGLSFTRPRDLDSEEAEALVEYLAAPLLAAHCLQIALRKTPSETEALSRMHTDAEQAYKELTRRFQELEEHQQQPIPDIWIR